MVYPSQMPPKTQKMHRIRASHVTTAFTTNGPPFALPAVEKRPTEKDIVNHIRICPSVTLSPARKLINAAIRANCLHITIGVPPGSPKTDESAVAPNFYYKGNDIMQLEPLLFTEHTMLNCTASVCMGDDCHDVENDEEAQGAIALLHLSEGQPSLRLYF